MQVFNESHDARLKAIVRIDDAIASFYPHLIDRIEDLEKGNDSQTVKDFLEKEPNESLMPSFERLKKPAWC